MATTMWFDQTIEDKKKPEINADLEFGRSSFYGENLLYFVIDGKMIILDKETGRKIYEAMQGVGAYLGYDR